MTHLLSVLLLLLKIHTTKSCAGISLKTQQLYVVVLLLVTWIYLLILIGIRSSSKDQDTFRYFFLGLPCFVLALLIREKFTFKEKLLLYFLSLCRCRGLETLTLTGQYVFLLGAFRGLYIFNWIYSYFTEPHFVHWIPWISGVVLTLLYADFFYYYFDSWKNNKKLQLPA